MERNRQISLDLSLILMLLIIIVMLRTPMLNILIESSCYIQGSRRPDHDVSHVRLVMDAFLPSIISSFIYSVFVGVQIPSALFTFFRSLILTSFRSYFCPCVRYKSNFFIILTIFCLFYFHLISNRDKEHYWNY